MRDNFERCLVLVLAHEGGWSDHSADPGGATNKGITLATYRAWVGKPATKDDLRNITDEAVEMIYAERYWDKVRGDDLPSGLDYAVFDFAVNSGPGRASKFLQRTVGAVPDGIIGPATLRLVGALEPSVIISRLCDARLAWLKRLKHWPTFGKGWEGRVRGVEGDALAMASRAPTAPEASGGTKTPGNPNPPPVASLWAFLRNLFFSSKRN